MRKDTTFSIRISKEDLELIKQNAKKARMSQSDYVTHCCLGRQIVVIEGLKELAKELRAIGNNLNQLTKRLHETGRIYDADLEAIHRSQDRIWTAVEKVVATLAKLLSATSLQDGLPTAMIIVKRSDST